jgi:L-ascorbate oxidase
MSRIFWFLATLLSCGLCKTREYNLTVTSGLVSPDSGPERIGILINGKLGGPEITAEPGDTLKINITNGLMEYTDGFSEMSIHWHGFDMKGVPFLDGTGYMSQCPIEENESMIVEFVVKEEPGTYMYHSHTSVLVADGLAGPLVIQEKEEPGPDAIVVVSEWFDTPAPELAKGLNLPFPLNISEAKQPSMFAWVGTPRSLLMNYQGCYQDCTTVSPTQQDCTPDPACSTRYSIQVLPNSVYRIRLIGAGSLAYQIVCFEGHNVTLVAIDARPVNPIEVGECVDVNLGQRRDVLLRTKDLKNQTSFWITGRVSERRGMPASYGVLQYVQGTGENQSITLPETPAPQPGDVPPSWVDTGFINNITSPNRDVEDYVISKEPTKTVLIEMAQPILQQTQQLRWAFSNVVFLATPRCTNTLKLMEDPDWLSPKNPYFIESAEDISEISITDIPGLGQKDGSGESFILSNMNYDRKVMPDQPVAGVPIVELPGGSVIDVIIQNNPAQDLGGIQINRTNSEQHPIHLHGHHFYILGTGKGDFLELQQNDPSWKSLLNYKNPQHADTATVGKDGWVYLRFIADNPGLWPIHCHIAWHEWMGMLMLFAEEAENIPPTPKNILPRCQKSCFYNAAPFVIEPPLSDNTSLTSTDDVVASSQADVHGYWFAKTMIGALLLAKILL